MALSMRKAKALAWIFSPEDMLARPDSIQAATVVVVDEIVRRLVFAPNKHVITLFDTADQYLQGPSPAVHDSYYREYLSNGIPRERIYEIWSNATSVMRGAGNQVPRNTVIAQYSDALTRQSRSLEAVCEKLRQDFRGSFKTKATHIPTSLPRGATGVAFDGKLWLWWDQLDFNASQLEAHIRLAMDGERLEATYEAILLKNGAHVRNDLYEFDVRPSSAEAKFKEDSMLTLGKVGYPGMPLQSAAQLLRPGAPTFSGNTDLLTRPLWSVLEAKLLSFDRARNKALVQLHVRDEPLLVSYLIQHSIFPLLDEVFLAEGKKPKQFNWAEQSAPILEAIGNPRISSPDNNAALAMGLTPSAKRGTSPETPAARVLWNPPALTQAVVMSSNTSQPLARYVAQLDGLNDSQERAVLHALERKLTLIWGPPGTGKTKTLSAFLHAISTHGQSAGHGLRVLVTGPTYKAVEEVLHRTAQVISADSAAPASIYMGYSQGRAHTPSPPGLASHVTYSTMTFGRTEPEDLRRCLQALTTNSGVVIVGCQVRQARQFPRRIAGDHLAQIFDVVVIDESSQVPVSHALSAFSGLRDDSRLIIAGDHLQMPPIAAIEAPAHARYLVGSIQTYLTTRQFSTTVPSCVLDQNYRSAEDIVAFGRYIGYPATLNAEYAETQLSLMRPFPGQAEYPVGLPWCPHFAQLLHPRSVVAALIHQDDISSQGNFFEAKIVAGIVWMLRQTVSVELGGRDSRAPNRAPTSHEFWTYCVGVVTPHRAQRALVIKELAILFPSEVQYISEAVDTVERFQGGERHTIIVTFGVGDVDVIGGEEAFLMQLERTNVAVSRAMAKSIVVMPDALANHIPEDRRALLTAHALKGYVDEFCNLCVPTTFTAAGLVRNAEIRIHQ
jgi:hypothetical protein